MSGNLEKQNTVSSLNQTPKCCFFSGNPEGSPRILFVGNSITYHAPKPDIGWFGSWGMAASSEDKDYVHLVMAEIIKKHPNAAFCVVQAATWERNYKGYDNDAVFFEAKDFKPDVIICGISENVPRDYFEAQSFKKELHNLHTYLSGGRTDTKVIQATSFFITENKDNAILEYCQEYGAMSVDLRDVACDESNLALGEYEHHGVSIHPGDKGMRCLADKYIAKLRELEII